MGFSRLSIISADAAAALWIAWAYIFDVASFQRTKLIVGEKVVPMELSELEVQDIDNETDWKLAELKFEMMVKNT